MNLWELTAPCHFGTEAVLKREILDLGYEVTKVCLLYTSPSPRD